MKYVVRIVSLAAMAVALGGCPSASNENADYSTPRDYSRVVDFAQPPEDFSVPPEDLSVVADLASSDTAMVAVDMAGADQAQATSTDSATATTDSALPPGDLAYVPPVRLTNGPDGQPVVLYGVTSDGYAVFVNRYNHGVYAASIDGTPPVTPIQIGSAPLTTGTVLVIDQMVFFWPTVDANWTGNVTVWRAGSSVTVNNVVYPYVAVKSDSTGVSTRIAYAVYGGTNGTSPVDVTGNLVVADPDDTNTSTLVAGNNLLMPQDGTASGATCYPAIQFAANRLLVGQCAHGATIGSATSYPAAGGTGTALVSGSAVSPYFSLSADGTKVAFLDAVGTMGGTLKVAPSDASSGATTIDSTHADVVDFRMMPDGNSIDYVTFGVYGAGTDLWKSATVSPSPTSVFTHATTDFVWGIMDLAPSAGYMTIRYYNNTTSLMELRLVNLTAGTTSTICANVATCDAGWYNSWGDAFTSDSSRLMYFTGVNPDGGSVGTVTTKPTATPATAGIARSGAKGYIVLAAARSLAVFNENAAYVSYKVGDMGVDAAVPRTDIRFVDTLATIGDAGVSVQSGADLWYSLTRDGKRVVYSRSDPGNVGIWTARLTW